MILEDKEKHITRLQELLIVLGDTSTLETQLNAAQNKHDELMSSLRRYMEENTRRIQDQEEYNRRFSEMEAECKKTEEEISQLQKEILAQSGRKEQLRRCLDKLRKCGDRLEEFDPVLWNAMAESVTVQDNGMLAFRFRDETEVPVETLDTKSNS